MAIALGHLLPIAIASALPLEAARAEVVAYDMVGSASQNLVSFVNDAPPFSSLGDCFGKLQRPDGPFAVLDDSLSIFAADSQGIIGEANLDEFFCVVDTENGDNSGPVSAEWVFDISGYDNLELAIDIGAMGDFEASGTIDFFTIEVAIDGGTPQTLFASNVDETASQDYTLDSGNVFTLSDPMVLEGTLLNNTLQTFSKSLPESGSELTVTLTAQSDGGTEAIAFQNLVISSQPTEAEVVAYDMVGSASQNLVDFVNSAPAFSSAGDCFGKLQRPDGPFAALDDSLTIFPSDSQGIIGEDNLDEFFCVVDTENGDNSGPVSAEWVFDISGYDNLELAVDIGAMGDFEASGTADFFTIEAAIDGGTPQLLFASSVDEDASQDYTMDSGNVFTLADPMLLDGTLLNNSLQTFSKALTGSGSELVVTLTAQGDGGTEAVVFQNLVVRSGDVAVDPFGACGDPATLIHEIQGSGPASPLDGATGIIVEAVVVGDFQATNELRGFFLQEEDEDADGNPMTSEGLFVFDNGFGVDLQPGDVVRVRGTVDEFFDLTELTGVTDVLLCATGASVTPAEISLPRDALSDWESTEGMSVVFPQELFVSGTFTLARFGEVDLAVGGPLDTPTNVVAPGAPAIALQAANDLRRIQLDDGSTVQNPLPLPPYLGDGNTLRVGDSTTGLTGVLSYGFGSYEVHPTAPVDFARLNARPEGPPQLGPALATVAGFNVLNYFTTLDDGSNDICGPAGNQECRGADSAAEFQRQKDKLLAALSILDADVVGLIEIENAPDDGPVADLVAGLNDIAGPGAFDYIPTGAIGSDAIRLALIYQPAAVSPLGDFALLDSTVDPDFLDTRNRPALAQTFQDNVGGEVFTVVVNHLKSKGSGCDDLGDVDTGDGQGNCNGVRTMAAQALVDWLASDPTASGDPDFLIIGDLNAYAQEDPIVTLENGGYVDLIEALVGTGWADGAYSYGFEAQAGYLDHALASASLAPAAGAAAAWHINADEPAGLDYNEFNQPGLYAPDEFRSSDHDAVVVALFSDDDEDGVWNDLDVCPGTTIPESVPERELNPNHFALVDGDLLFDTAPLNGEGPGDAFDLFDTAGCSCEQIIEAWALGKGHRKFGCSVEVMRDWQEHVSGL